jgi:ribonuclease-3
VSSINTDRLARLSRLERRLHYAFSDKALLDQALTHKSHSREHNERLEFLGDAVLGYVVADVLYADHPELAEDALSIIRAELVRKETLGNLAQELGIGEYLRLGAGERKGGGRERVSILADALEAIIGAVSLDGGLEAARALVLELEAGPLSKIRERSTRAVKDAKTRLQELLQAASRPLPVYEVVATSGAEHRKTFTVSCAVDSMSLTTTGSGSSRRAAEKAAARAMIERVREGGLGEL